MATAGDIIATALKAAGILGVGQTALTEDTSDALDMLNGLVDEWQLTRPNVYHSVDLAFTSTAAASYTVGPTGNFVATSKPTQIDGAFARLISTGVDTPLTIITARESTIGITAKAATGAPTSVFYDPTETNGVIWIYPIPPATYSIHLVFRESLPTFASTATVLALPRGYINALRWNLAVRLRSGYGLPADPEMLKLAEASLVAIEAANNLAVFTAPPHSGTTPAQLIALAMRAAGVEKVGGRSISSQDTYDAFFVLNQIVAQWNRKRWLVNDLVDTAITSTGATSYTIGSGGDVAVARPDRIEAAYVRSINNVGASGYVDYSVQIIEAREDWSRISLKTMSSGANGFPGALFYDSASPLGVLYFWPIPGTRAEMHIVYKNGLTAFTGLTQAITLPPEYSEALTWNLAVRLRPLYGLPPDPTIAGLAAAALSTIRGANLQVPRLEMPGALGGGRNWSIEAGFAWAGGPWIPDPSTLPTTLPSTPGVYWNNGGVVAIS